MAEQSSGSNISLESLLAMAETQVSDLGRLGIEGLPSALEALGITEPERVSRIVQAAARTTFREIAHEIHPDVSDQSVDDTGSDNFRLVLSAMKRITANPQAAIDRQRVLTSPEAGRAKLEAVRGLEAVQQLGNRIGELRRQKTDLLYRTPYSQLFSLAEGEVLHIDVTPVAFSYEPEDFSFMNRYPVSTVAELVIDGDEITVGKIKLVSLQTRARLDTIRKAAAANESFFKPLAALMTRTLSNARIIGAGQIGSTFEDDDTSARLTRTSTLASLSAGHITPDPLTLVYNNPHSYEAIDDLSLRIPKPLEASEGWQLFLAARNRGALKVGALGNYSLTPKRQTGVVELYP